MDGFGPRCRGLEAYVIFTLIAGYGRTRKEGFREVESAKSVLTSDSK